MAFQLTYHGSNTEFYESVAAFIREWNAGMETITLNTSGSTGPPKQIALRREQLIASARRTNAYFDLEPSANVVMALSPSVIGGKMMIIRAMEGSLHLHLTDPAANPLKNLPENLAVDFIPLVPMQLKTILEETPEKIDNVRKILLGGSPVGDDLETRFAKLGPEIFVGFGMTETVSHIAVRNIGEETYSALENVAFSEENGALIISDTLLGIDSMKTSDAVDLVNKISFKWLGRTDFTINSGGIKLHPEEIEKVLAGYIRHPFIVSSLPDTTFGEACILIIEAAEMTYNMDEIREICRNKTGKFSAPKAIYYSTIQTTSAGKTDRNATRKQLLENL